MTWRPATRQAAVYALAGALATGGYYLLSGDAQAIWYEVIGASAVAAMWLGVRGRTGSDRLAWQLFAIGMMGQVAGDVATRPRRSSSATADGSRSSSTTSCRTRSRSRPPAARWPWSSPRATSTSRSRCATPGSRWRRSPRHAIVEAHVATIEIESAEFAGTCVRVTPPAAEPAFPFA